MAGIFITTATGKALEDQISLMDKRTNEWTMRAAVGRERALERKLSAAKGQITKLRNAAKKEQNHAE